MQFICISVLRQGNLKLANSYKLILYEPYHRSSFECVVANGAVQARLRF